MYRFLDFDTKFKQIRDELINSKEHKYGPSGKLIVSSAGGAVTNPWIYIKKPGRKWCHYYWQIYCNKAGIIPEFCRFHCWKVIVSLTVQPNEEMPTGRFGTVEEMFMLYNLARMLDLPSKVGMDVRGHTYGIWRGYFYADSLENAKEYYAIVKPQIDQHFEPGVDVRIQRGCTEMNARLASRYWDLPRPAEELRLEKKLTNLIEFEEFDWQLSEETKHETKEWWIETAIQIGDPSARRVLEQLSNDPDVWKRLVVHSDTYHEKDPRDELSKEDMTGFAPLPSADEVLDYFDKTLDEMGISNEQLTNYIKTEAHIRGIEESNSMQIVEEVINTRDFSQIHNFCTQMKQSIADWEEVKMPHPHKSPKKKKQAPKKKAKK